MAHSAQKIKNRRTLSCNLYTTLPRFCAGWSARTAKPSGSSANSRNRSETSGRTVPFCNFRARKNAPEGQGDAARSRGFFSHYCTHLLPLKREWFRNRENVTVLQTEGLTAVQAGEQAARWCAGRAGIARE